MRINDVVDLATSEPPPLRYTVDDIVESGKRVQRRRRLAWLGSGAATVAVLGIVGAVAVPPLSAGMAQKPAASASTDTDAATVPGPPFPASAPPFAYTFTGYQVGKLRVAQPIDVSTAYQLASIYADGLVTSDKSSDPNVAPPNPAPPGLWAYLTVYRPGAYDPTKLAGAKQVTVAGRPGLETEEPGDHGWAMRRILAWQIGADAWAVIASSSDKADYPSADDLRKLAAGLRPATPASARIPIQVGYVPSGYQLQEASMHAMTSLNGIASARDGDYAGLMFSKPALPTTGLTEAFGGLDGAELPGSFLVFVLPAGNSNQKPSPGISCLEGFCSRWYAGDSIGVQVESQGPGGLSNSEMTKILNGITVGNVNDDSTWTEVGTAIH